MKKLLLILFLVTMTYSQVIFTNKCRLTWNKKVETDLAGYKIYESKDATDNYTTVVDVGKDTSFLWTFTDIDSFLEKKQFAVTAYDTSGNESGFSNNVSIIVSPSNYLFGDYNGDKRVDSYDLTIFWAFMSIGRYDRKFDVNLDGRLDNTDHLYLVINHGQKME